jgi:hypothetical protein
MAVQAYGEVLVRVPLQGKTLTGITHLRDDERRLGSKLLEATTFTLRETAPNTEALIVCQRVVEALDPNFTGKADLLGLTSRAALFGKERLGISLGTQRATLPFQKRVGC